MIVINDNRKSKNFKFLGKGAVFELNGKYYIKIQDTVRGGSILNAVELSNGDLLYIDRDDIVIECQNVTIEINE